MNRYGETNDTQTARYSRTSTEISGLLHTHNQPQGWKTNPLQKNMKFRYIRFFLKHFEPEIVSRWNREDRDLCIIS